MQVYHGSSVANVEMMSAVLIQKKLLTSRYVLITIGFPKDRYLRLQPGDHLYVFPENNSNHIEQILKFCLDKPVEREIAIWQGN